MAENDVPDSPDRGVDPAANAPDQAAQTAERPAAGPPGGDSSPVLKTRWRDRAWSFRAMIAVALASVVIGGLAGGAVVAASGDDNDREQRMGPWGPGGGMPPGWRERGPRDFRGDGGPRWRWEDGPREDDPTPQSPSPSPTTPGSTS